MPNYISDNTGYEVDSIIDSFNHFRKTIIVHCPSGSTVTVSNGQETYTKVSTTTDLIFNPKAYGVYTITCLYGDTTQIESLEIDKVKIYEVFFSEEGGAFLTFRSANQFSLSTANSTKNWDGTIEYATDGELWNIWDGTTTITPANNVLYLRGTRNSYISPGNFATWNIVGSGVSCTGNIETLLDYATVELGNHPTMNVACYQSMFSNCTSLVKAPQLPATTLAPSCYQNMFYGCTNLLQAPELPARVFPALGYCYAYMFHGCTSLTTPPALPATTLVVNCYQAMFTNCTSLATAPELPATTIANYCYNGMFQNCTSLTVPPELPATTLAENCYQSMFQGCLNIKLYTERGSGTVEYRIPPVGTGAPAIDSLKDMFTGTGGDNIGTPSTNITYFLDVSGT